MRMRNDALLAPHCSKETALRLLKNGLDLKDYHSVGKIARELLARQFTLTNHEKLVLATGLRISADDEYSRALWDEAIASMTSLRDRLVIAELGLSLVDHAFHVRDALAAYRALTSVGEHIGDLPENSWVRRQYDLYVDDYLRLTGDPGGAGILRR